MTLRDPKATRERRGFSLIELLIVLAVVGTLLAVGFVAVRPPASRVYANDVRALIQQARFEAVKLNVPVAIVWDVSDSSFVVGTGTVAAPCAIDTELSRASSSEYPRLTVDPGFEEGGGLVWLPSGQARSCDYGTYVETIAYVDDGRVEREITVSLTGRVTIE